MGGGGAGGAAIPPVAEGGVYAVVESARRGGQGKSLAEGAMLAHAITVAANVDDVALMEQPIYLGGGHDEHSGAHWKSVVSRDQITRV